MGKIKIFDFAKGTGSIQLEYKTGLFTELIPDLLDNFLDFSCFLVVSFSFQFYCILVNQLWVSFGDLAFASSFAPDLLHNFQHFWIYLPWYRPQVIQNTVETLQICIHDHSLLNFAFTVSHKVCGLKVIPADLRFDPRQGRNDCRNWTLLMQEKIALLLQFGNYCRKEILVNFE